MPMCHAMPPTARPTRRFFVINEAMPCNLPYTHTTLAACPTCPTYIHTYLPTKGIHATVTRLDCAALYSALYKRPDLTMRHPSIHPSIHPCHAMHPPIHPHLRLRWLVNLDLSFACCFVLSSPSAAGTVLGNKYLPLYLPR
ncbi:hypothetical protein DM02DRAFT_220117 [Periconia macrospinosa]|uniref:Uncharacterized protein n=1 Tax=Periconia macrospinosa TaxID=97972 RepID=A0A2V1DZW7_9PLEO|nr:hypothetical protein DM02DRAFT_220117 [Periconia macrospinosa]